MDKRRVLIAGGGIGGLSAALALTQSGCEVVVYEQVHELYELGAGIAIAPNGSRVLTELGLRTAIEAIASSPPRRSMRLFDTGQAWVAPIADTDGFPFWLVHRADLHKILANELEQRAPGSLHVGACCVGFEQDETGASLILDNGERIRGDALVGADGVRSRIRHELFGECSATFTGFVAWRAVVPMERLPGRLRAETFTAWMGPCGQIVTYPLRKGKLLNVVAIVRRSDWQTESWSEAGTVDEFKDDFSGWHDDVLATIDAVYLPYKWALMGRPALEHCSVGRVTLLGDAFHPTLPLLGEGGNMALEDSLVLSRCIKASNSIPAALYRYEIARLDRTSRIMRDAFDHITRLDNELGDPAQAVAYMTRLFAIASGDSTFNWMHEYDAVGTPV